MRTILLFSLFALSTTAQATNNECRGDCGPKPDVNIAYGGDQKQSQGQSQSADATAVAGAIAVSGAAASADNKNINSVSNHNDVDVNTSDYNANLNKNDNTNINVAEGGAGGRGGDGGNAIQGQSQYSDNSNSSNNSSSQSTSLTFESTGEADHYNKYGNNVAAYAPAIYSASACTGGGISGGASALGVGVALGGARQIKACQTLENARVLGNFDSELALIYLCTNPNVDIGATLGAQCKPKVAPPVAVKPDPPVVTPPIQVVTDVVKGK